MNYPEFVHFRIYLVMRKGRETSSSPPKAAAAADSTVRSSEKAIGHNQKLSEEGRRCHALVEGSRRSGGKASTDTYGTSHDNR
jgi:hypothetical protein